MIEKRTVLVLGAGASAPYGFPLGFALTNQIANIRNSESQRLMVLAGANATEIKSMASALQGSRIYSIDAFLARRTEFSEVGRLAIATIIKQAELARPTVKCIDANDDWYRLLWNELARATWDELSQHQLSVITFNYDRSLQRYLSLAAVATYGKELADCEKKLASIPFVHVYGSVRGQYDPASDFAADYYFTGPGGIRDSADGIKVIAEGRDDSEEIRQAREILQHAERIAFLGFSFDPMNMRRLDARNTCRDRTKQGNVGYRVVEGTVFGMTREQTRVRAVSGCNAQPTDVENGYPVTFLPMKSLPFLNERLTLG